MSGFYFKILRIHSILLQGFCYLSISVSGFLFKAESDDLEQQIIFDANQPKGRLPYKFTGQFFIFSKKGIPCEKIGVIIGYKVLGA